MAPLSQKKFLWLLFIAVAAFAAVLMLCSPMFTDDYDFASLRFRSFSEVLHYCLHYGNGRLIGNVGAALFAASVPLRTAVRALMLAGLVVLLPLTVQAKRRTSWLISFLLVFGVAPTMFGEVYSWASGFQNYVPPVFLLVLCLLLWQDAERGRCPLWLRSAAMLLLALAAQLYVELDSIVLCLAALTALILSRKQSKPRRVLAALWLAGALAGGGIMLAIPRLFEREYQLIAFYRHVYLSSVSEMLSSVWTNGLKLLGFFTGACFLCLAMGLAVFLLLGRSRDAWRHPRAYRAARAVSLALPLYSLVYRAFFNAGRFVWLPALPKLLFALLCIGFLFVFVCAAAHSGDRRLLLRICVLLGLAVCAIGPMLVVYPAPERSLYLCYILLACAALAVWEHILPSLNVPLQKPARLAACIAAGILSLLLLLQFAAVAYTDRLNTEYIERQLAAGSTQISLITPPSDYVYRNTSSYLGHYYYLETPNDVQFSFTDYASWSAARSLEQPSGN